MVVKTRFSPVSRGCPGARFAQVMPKRRRETRRMLGPLANIIFPIDDKIDRDRPSLQSVP